MKEIYVIGIDTGLRNSLGCVGLNVDLNVDFLESFCPKKRKKTLNVKDKRAVIFSLSRLSKEELRKVLRCDYVNVFSLKSAREKTRFEAASFVSELCSEYFMKGKVVVVLEDFVFFGRSKNGSAPRASWYVVAKVQNLVGYLYGFMEARGFEVRVVKPRSWKVIVDPFHVTIANKLVEARDLMKFKKGVEHVYSAFGVALSQVVNVLSF